MKPPFNLAALAARMAQIRDPLGPVTRPLPHGVTLPAPTSYEEQYARWDKPQAWCRLNVGPGGNWTRRRIQETGEIRFEFSDLVTGTMFKLLFR